MVSHLEEICITDFAVLLSMEIQVLTTNGSRTIEFMRLLKACKTDFF